MQRRTFLGAAASLSVLPTTVTATETTPTPTRRSIRSLRRHDPDDIIPTWREGIRTLKSLPDDDPRNWDNQVRIHGNSRRFVNCEHGNWLFLAWHRAFLHFHEDIIREVTGNEAFALPYWNWLDNTTLPSLFRRRPFRNQSRTPNSALDTTIASRDRITPALEDPNFFRAIGGWAGEADRDGYVRSGSGAFESPGHDYVHIRVGGDMATGLSPNDPSFWAHHSMMDRLWWEWAARGHAHPADERWLDWTFEDHLVDRHGDIVDAVSVADVLGLPERAYSYATRVDGSRASGDPASQTTTADVGLETRASERLASDTQLRADGSITGTVERSTVESALTGPGRVLVTARDIAMPTDGWFHGRVYVDPSSPNPGPNAPNYAGTYHLWIAPPEHPPQNQYVDITDTLSRLDAAGELDDTIDIVVEGDKMRGKGNVTPSTPIETVDVEVTQSRIDGDIVEY